MISDKVKIYRNILIALKLWGNPTSGSKDANKSRYKGGGPRAWGGDLIVFVGPGVEHLTDLVLSGEGISEYFLARRGDI